MTDTVPTSTSHLRKTSEEITSRRNKMYAIMGISGRVGGAIAENLLAQGEQIRAIVRNPEKAARWRDRGAEIAIADVDDADALASAFAGTDGVFLMVPPNFAPAPGFPETRKTLAAYHAALGKALPKKAVYLSSIGAEQTSGLGLITSSHLLEQTLGDLPIAHAFLRAGWFMENHAWDVTTAQSEGKIFSNLYPLDRKFSLVATADIGKAGADVLRQEWKGTRYIEVAGPEQYSPNDIARALSSALGRTIEAVAVPRENWTEFFIGQGMPVGRTEPRAEMVDGFNSGWIHFGVAGTEHVTGNTSLRSVIGKLATNGNQEE
jgi:NAD(P)H dehydrogenase (quinone)